MCYSDDMKDLEAGEPKPTLTKEEQRDKEFWDNA